VDCARFIGIPFLPHGRTRDGCDCYGLVRLALAEEYGVTLPAFVDGYDDFSDHQTEANIINEKLPLIGAARVAAPEEGDIVLMRYLGIASHVGLYARNGMVLHVEERQGFSRLEKIDSPMIRSRVMGFYRIPGVAA